MCPFSRSSRAVPQNLPAARTRKPVLREARESSSWPFFPCSFFPTLSFRQTRIPKPLFLSVVDPKGVRLLSNVRSRARALSISLLRSRLVVSGSYGGDTPQTRPCCYSCSCCCSCSCSCSCCCCCFCCCSSSCCSSSPSSCSSCSSSPSSSCPSCSSCSSPWRDGEQEPEQGKEGA